MPEENQLSLIEEEGDFDLQAFYKQVDRLSSDDLQWAITRWPESLQTLYALTMKELAVLTFDDECKRRLAVKLVHSQSNYLGGRDLYLPTGKALNEALRDLDIFTLFNGHNHAHLAKKHHLVERSIYEIVAKQRKIQFNRRQKSLF